MEATPDAAELLSYEDLRQLDGLVLAARRRVSGGEVGRHRGRGLGQSAEFHDFRSYVAGDEPRRVDWKLFGRTDRLYVRQYRHDAALRVHLIVDRSASMAYEEGGAGGGGGKWVHARRLAAGLAWLAAGQQDRVRLTWLADRAEPVVGEGRTPGHLRRLLAALAAGRAAGRAEPERALVDAASLGSRGGRGGEAGLTVVVSDLLDESERWLRGLGAMGWGDLMVLQVLSPSELDPGGLGGGRLVDPERGRTVRTDPRRVAGDYRRRMGRYLEGIAEGVAGMGGQYALIRTDEPIGVGLRRALAWRERARGAGLG